MHLLILLTFMEIVVFAIKARQWQNVASCSAGNIIGRMSNLIRNKSISYITNPLN